MNNNKNRGSLWARKSKNGMDYFGGRVSIDGKSRRIVLFVNKSKKTEKSPDMSILID